jgi:hypothetical protein
MVQATAEVAFFLRVHGKYSWGLFLVQMAVCSDAVELYLVCFIVVLPEETLLDVLLSPQRKNFPDESSHKFAFGDLSSDIDDAQTLIEPLQITYFWIGEILLQLCILHVRKLHFLDVSELFLQNLAFVMEFAIFPVRGKTHDC